MKPPNPERRRGSMLEAAILDAAWDELVEKGYAGLTMEAVAQRAQTSRPVLYRRWADRAELAVAAIQHFLAQRPVRIPELGSVREEMISLLRQYADRGPPVMMLTTLAMSEYYKETTSAPHDLRRRILEGEELPWRDVMLRGVQRGEIDPKKLTPRIISLAQDLLRHEFLMTQELPSDELLAEIVDDIFLPLVTP
jgi:AcrR family transcriptional regulator